MADFSQTITNRIDCFGPAPTTKWGSGSPYSMTWGTSKWGEGTEDLVVSISKTLGETISLTDNFGTAAQFNRTATWGEISTSYEGVEETLQDGSGYYYVFPKPTTDSDEQYIPSYASGSVSPASWTSGSTSVIIWS